MKFIIGPGKKHSGFCFWAGHPFRNSQGCSNVCHGNCDRVCFSHCSGVGNIPPNPQQPGHHGNPGGGMFGPYGIFGPGGLFGNG